MRIAHVTNFKKPAISPFFYVRLDLIERLTSGVKMNVQCKDAPQLSELPCVAESFWRPLLMIL